MSAAQVAIFTFPGCLGDALLQWPVAFQYATQRNAKIAVWLDQGKLAPLAPLLAIQPCIETVSLQPGITNYGCGGQPWNFGGNLTASAPIFHMGLRWQPQDQITLETLKHYPQFDLDPSTLLAPSLRLPFERANRCIVHLTSTTHLGAIPAVWEFLDTICDDLNAMFDEVVIVGHASEVRSAFAEFSEWNPLYDNGNLLHVGALMAGARLVIGAGSSMVALAGALGVPSIRIHDPAGNSKHVFANLGRNHMNEPLAGALHFWPSFRDALAQWEG